MASRDIYQPGSQVFYINPQTGWNVGTLKEAGKKTMKVEDKGEVFTVAAEDIHRHMEGSYDERFEDLFQMADLHQSTLLYCLKRRYEKLGMMFTRMGEIIISINPLCVKDYNHPSKMAPHTGGNWAHPHAWEVAHKAYKKIVVMDGNNQSILISGESGAGKTETAKTLIDYLGCMSYSHSCNGVQKAVAESVNKKLKASNPILESFGNAKTLRNDNSSRFGKYIKLYFEKTSGVLTGAEMVHYLLEKSRIVTQNPGERGYHVFYEMLCGMSPEQKAKYGGLTKPQDYACLSKGNQFIREGHGRVTDDAVEFKNLCQAFKDTGITDDEQHSIFSVLAAILWLQNLKFETDDSTGKAKIVQHDLVEKVAKLLKVDATKFKECMLVKTRTKIMTQMADKNEACDMRDALSKALYSGLFDWLVDRLNKAIKLDERSSGDLRYVGLLDIFGFENFKINSFEQFCINFTNESLQNHYNKYTFIQDAQECEAEGIACPIVEYPDNQPCLDMLQKDKTGVMSILDDQCNFRLGTDSSFTEAAWNAYGDHKFFVKPRSTVPDRFSIKHYAATVEYKTAQWLEKNSDTLKEDMQACIAASSEKFIGSLIAPPGDSTKKKPTVGWKFKKQLESLKEELNSTDSHFIRTVKPNPQMKAGVVDNAYVMTQLTCAGVIETIMMKRQGYPVRQPHKEFWLRYRIIAPKKLKNKYPHGKQPSPADLPDACREIAKFWVWVMNSPSPNFDIGHSKVFTKSGVSEGLELQRHRKVKSLLPKCIPYLLRWIKSFLKKKKELEERRKKAQQGIQAATTRSANDVRQQSAGLQDGDKAKTFTDLARLFPHFDLPVIFGVVQNARDKKIAMDFLLDMQKQRVREALPLTVQSLFEEAKLSEATQEALIQQRVTSRQALFSLSPADMSRMGFTVEERDSLQAVLLRQQSNWIVNQRLNLLMGNDGRSDAELKRDMDALELAAAEVKKDLEGHLAGKYGTTLKSSTRPSVVRKGSSSRGSSSSSSEVKWCVVCGKRDQPMEYRSSGWKCVSCKGKPASTQVAAYYASKGYTQPGAPSSSPAAPETNRTYTKAPAGSYGAKLPAGSYQQSTPSTTRSSAPPAPSPGGGGGGVDPAAVRRLGDMGFPESKARQALQRTGGDSRKACELLLQGAI
eukprot:TRINITY_DN3264_c0_g1_i1.p1 TRINITY_DN3264_c0_g1~~TRINITY_DN3264_c0_g1_i1.p1  ORF type:complete len:1148 (+),score=277.12 TRINITY_DN3264_c0_g1_i1:50-3493(+)